MKTVWRLFDCGAIGRDALGGGHTASDWTYCECGEDHRAEVGSAFGIRFEQGALRSHAEMVREFAHVSAEDLALIGSMPAAPLSTATTGEVRVSAGEWARQRELAAVAIAEADAPSRDANTWPVRSEYIGWAERNAATLAVMQAARELGIEELPIAWFRQEGPGARFFGCVSPNSDRRIQLRSDLAEDGVRLVVRHEMAHVALYDRGLNWKDEAACDAYARRGVVPW